MVKNKISAIKKVMIGFLTLVGLAVLGIILIDLQVKEKSAGQIYSDFEKLPVMRIGLVLGASVWNNRIMSNMLQDRADTALELYHKGKIQKFLISGDNRRVDYNEVIVVKNYLVQKGVPDSDIFLDYAGFDTYDSLYRARDIFQVKELVIVTQKFHLPRAIYLGSELGLKVVGFGADRRQYRNIEFNLFREKIANIKAFLDLKLKAKPQFLGDVIPII